MNDITEKDVKRVWVEKDAICVELKDSFAITSRSKKPPENS